MCLVAALDTPLHHCVHTVFTFIREITHEFNEKHGFCHRYMEDIYYLKCCLEYTFIALSVCKYLSGNPLCEATVYGISSFPNHSAYLTCLDSNGCFLFPAGKFFGTQKRESSLLCHSTVLVCWTPKKRWPITVSPQILDLKYILYLCNHK